MPLESKTSSKTFGLCPRLVTAGAIVAICSFTAISLIRNRGFGSRGTRKVYTFHYNERVEAIICDDIIWGRDRYVFSLENKKKGILKSDHGTKITISGAKDKPYGFNWDAVLP